MNASRRNLARRILYSFLAIAVLLALAYPLLRAADQQPPAEGVAAPDFTLPSQEGKQVSLHDFKGKWVVLYFYPKDFSSGCTIEAHNFQRDQAQYEAKNVAIVGVSVDTVDSHQGFCTKEGLSFKLLSDTDKKVTALYGSLGSSGATAARHTFVINPKGVIVKEYMTVNATGHSEELLAALPALQAAK